MINKIEVKYSLFDIYKCKNELEKYECGGFLWLKKREKFMTLHYGQ